MGCRNILSPAFTLAVAGALTVAGLGAPGAGADPLGDAKSRLAAARASATEAAQRYTDAIAEQARQESEIARLAAEIPRLRARADELRTQVLDRAVQLYQQGSAMPISRMVEAENAIDAARAISLTSTAASHDRDIASELTRTAEQLVKDEQELRTRREAQSALIAQLAVQHEQLDTAVAAADAAVRNLEAVGFAQASFRDVSGAAAGQIATGASICPVGGVTVFVNDWGAPRSGGRTHKGNDLFAARETPLVAVVDGVVLHDVDDLGGIGVWLVGDDGVSYYYAHLSHWEGDGRRVARGEVVGYVGDTGNARGGPPHLHFGVRAPDGEMVNPYPTVRALCPQ